MAIVKTLASRRGSWRVSGIRDLAVAIVINPARHVQRWASRVIIAAEAAIFTQDARNFGKEAAMVVQLVGGVFGNKSDGCAGT